MKRTTLSEPAVNPNNFDKQKVALANSVFHEKTYAALSLDGKIETSLLIYHVNKLWKILNTRYQSAHIILNDIGRSPFSEPSDSRFTYLLDFSASISRSLNYKGNRRDRCLTRETTSSLVQTLDALVALSEELLRSNSVKYVVLGSFQSDVLESEFGILWQLFGGFYHISLEQVLAGGKLRRLCLYKSLNILDDVKAPEQKMQCCEEELTYEELDDVDDIVANPMQISDHERSAIFYVCGYIAYKESIELCERSNVMALEEQ